MANPGPKILKSCCGEVVDRILFFFEEDAFWAGPAINPPLMLRAKTTGKKKEGVWYHSE